MMLCPKLTGSFKWTWSMILAMVLKIVCTSQVTSEEHHPLDNPAGITVNCPEIPKFPECPKIPACPKCPDIVIPKNQCPSELEGVRKRPDSDQQALPHGCKDVKSPLPRKVVTLSSGLKVMCDTQTDGGGWIIFQRRVNGQEDFYRGWEEYKNGFGNIDGGSFWLGNEVLHQLTFSHKYELRVDFTFKGRKYFAEYSNFRVLGEDYNYQLEVGDYSGTAGDSFAGPHSGMSFSTKDKENDKDPNLNCAQTYHGAWWYAPVCHKSNLNGEWGSKAFARGLTWELTTGFYDTATFTEMKIRQIS